MLGRNLKLSILACCRIVKQGNVHFAHRPPSGLLGTREQSARRPVCKMRMFVSNNVCFLYGMLREVLRNKIPPTPFRILASVFQHLVVEGRRDFWNVPSWTLIILYGLNSGCAIPLVKTGTKRDPTSREKVPRNNKVFLFGSENGYMVVCHHGNPWYPFSVVPQQPTMLEFRSLRG